MKLSQNTNTILKNFASLNPNMLFRVGSNQKTINSTRTVLAIAKISEQIPREFAIYDLNQFLATLSLFEDPDLSFTDKQIKITNGTGALANFVYTNKESIISAPDKEINLASTDIVFNLDAKAMTNALTAASVLGNLPEIVFVGRDGKTYLSALNTKDSSSHNWEMPVGKAEKNYSMVFRTENVKNILERDYEVFVSSKGISKFVSKTGDVTYYIAIETNSKYDI